MHFSTNDVITPEETIWTALNTNVTAAMWAHTPTSSKVDFVTLTNLDGVSGSVVKNTGVPAKWCGASGATAPIAQASVIAKLTTGGRGRSRRGRLYLPWPDESMITAGSYSTADRTTQQTAWNTFLATVSGVSARFVVASYKLVDFVPVTAVTIEQLCGTQRRRQPRP
jgi:hypothetical protein